MGSTANPTHQHAIQFYVDDSSALNRIVDELTGCLQAGRTAVCIAREEFHPGLRGQLTRKHIDVPTLEGAGRLLVLGSRETSERLVKGGIIDEHAFQKFVDEVLGRVHGAQGICAHGDIVDVLCQRGDFKAAIALESLWSEVLSRSPVHLL